MSSQMFEKCKKYDDESKKGEFWRNIVIIWYVLYFSSIFVKETWNSFGVWIVDSCSNWELKIYYPLRNTRCMKWLLAVMS